MSVGVRGLIGSLVQLSVITKRGAPNLHACRRKLRQATWEGGIEAVLSPGYVSHPQIASDLPTHRRDGAAQTAVRQHLLCNPGAVLARVEHSHVHRGQPLSDTELSRGRTIRFCKREEMS